MVRRESIKDHVMLGCLITIHVYAEIEVMNCNTAPTTASSAAPFVAPDIQYQLLLRDINHLQSSGDISAAVVSTLLEAASLARSVCSCPLAQHIVANVDIAKVHEATLLLHHLHIISQQPPSDFTRLYNQLVERIKELALSAENPPPQEQGQDIHHAADTTFPDASVHSAPLPGNTGYNPKLLLDYDINDADSLTTGTGDAATARR